MSKSIPGNKILVFIFLGALRNRGSFLDFKEQSINILQTIFQCSRNIKDIKYKQQQKVNMNNFKELPV